MRHQWTDGLILVILAVCVVGALSSCSSPTPTPVPTATASPSSTPSPTSTPLADANAILSSRCTGCHTLERVVSSKKSSDQWTATINRMLPLMNPAERVTLVDYLVKNYGPS